jgi:hypothetical protein
MQVATAPVLRKSRAIWHVRGTWSAREDRVASAVWLGVLWVGIGAGFAVDFSRYLQESPAPPRIVHVHAAVFTVWMLLLTAQVLLVLGNRVAWHRRLGWFAAGWACLMAVIGPWAAIAWQAVHLQAPVGDVFLLVDLADTAGFLTLLAWAITLRKNPAAHRRLTILATIALADPGFGRLSAYFLPEPTSPIPWFFLEFYGNLLLIVLMLGWDWWRGRLMRSFVLAAGALLASEAVATLLYLSAPCKALAIGWAAAWAKLWT